MSKIEGISPDISPGSSTVANIPEPDAQKSIFDISQIFTRETLRERQEEAKKLKHIKYLEYQSFAISMMKRGVLEANENGEKKYSFTFAGYNKNHDDLFIEVEKILTSIFVDSVIKIQRRCESSTVIEINWEDTHEN